MPRGLLVRGRRFWYWGRVGQMFQVFVLSLQQGGCSLLSDYSSTRHGHLMTLSYAGKSVLRG